MKKTSLLLMAVAVFTLSCKNDKESQEESVNMEPQEENIPEDQDSDIALFDGQNMDNWKAYNADEITEWKIEDNALAFSPTEGREGSQNLISKDEYTNFELSLEYKIAEGGNSGIMWGVQEDEKFGEPYLT
ncbi:DUF1080 domain-containing protein [Antarcticibacterium sp. 1MA-6-2]|uniref:3-keto-disaccharide hydrolase n=1 Tax=Antarcticibacterium sp. 1MA-6-2 TaxID=2908210 RepID=UPI002883354B|nr:DUF1080 domain-containing protein [Antarcticibacterium sp. 1MA-6-2]